VPTLQAAATQVAPTIQAAAPTVQAAATQAAPTVQAAATRAAPTIQAAATQAGPTVQAAATQAAPTVQAAATQAATAAAASPIRIASVQSTPSDATISVQNTSSTSANLSGWTVQVGTATAQLPSGLTVQPNQTLTLHTGDGTSTSSDVYLGPAARNLTAEVKPGARVLLQGPSGPPAAFVVPGA
jgi:hypothetical protein